MDNLTFGGPSDLPIWAPRIDEQEFLTLSSPLERRPAAPSLPGVLAFWRFISQCFPACAAFIVIRIQKGLVRRSRVPSPIAHTFMGWVVYRIWRRRMPHSDEGWLGPFPRLLVATTSLSILPDLDVVPAILKGDLGRFHNNVMSSLMAGMVVALGVGGLVGLSQHSKFLKWFVLTLVCYELHLIMDFFTVGRGVMLLWPFSSNHYRSSVKLFYGLRWSDGWFSVRHLWTLLTELGFVVIVGLTIHVLSKSKP